MVAIVNRLVIELRTPCISRYRITGSQQLILQDQTDLV